MTTQPHPLQSTLQALLQAPRGDGLASIVAVASAFSQSGSSHIARELSLLAAAQFEPGGGRVGLMDLDLNNQAQAEYFDRPGQIAKHGALTGPYDATFGHAPFWQVSPDMIAQDGGRSAAQTFCGLFMLGQTGLFVSQFDWTSVKSGQSVHVIKSPDYWQAARSQFSIIIVDCPAFDRSDIGLNVTSYADAAILTSPESRSSDPEHGALSARIEDAGGYCAGLVLNAGAKSQSFAGYVS